VNLYFHLGLAFLKICLYLLHLQHISIGYRIIVFLLAHFFEDLLLRSSDGKTRHIHQLIKVQ